VRSGAIKLRLTLPSAGRVKVHGKFLRRLSRRVHRPGSRTVTVRLKAGPRKRRLRGRTISTKAIVWFRPDTGESSKIQVALKFLGAKKKGRK
jgi:hypothetical protein